MEVGQLCDPALSAFGDYPSWEYQELQPEYWKARYGGMRCFLWDTTDVRLLGAPSHPDLQKAAYSNYYGGCVLKGGVGICPFGWVIPAPLFTGDIADTDYMTEAGIFRRQMELAEAYGGPPATNITDKGMRCSEVALEYGGQQFLTPAFCRRGESQALPSNAFRTNAIAADRAHGAPPLPLSHLPQWCPAQLQSPASGSHVAQHLLQGEFPVYASPRRPHFRVGGPPGVLPLINSSIQEQK
jgi:hypothetical protein